MDTHSINELAKHGVSELQSVKSIKVLVNVFVKICFTAIRMYSS